MGSPAIFKGKRTYLLTEKGLQLKDGTRIDNDGFVNFVKNGRDPSDTSGWQVYDELILRSSSDVSTTTDDIELGVSGLDGYPVRFMGTDVPQGLTAGQTYYLKAGSTATRYGLSSTIGGSAADLITTGSSSDNLYFILLRPKAGESLGYTSNPQNGYQTPPSFTVTNNGIISGSSEFCLVGAQTAWGLRYDFSIDPVYKNNLVDFDISYIANSSIFSEGCYSLYLYDVDNGAIIEGLPRDITAGNQTRITTHKTKFPLTTSLNYRLLLHPTGGGASDWSFSKVEMRPQSYVYGSPVSDTKSYTPNFTGCTWHAGTIYDVEYNRSGSYLEMTGTISQSSAGTHSAGPYQLHLPSGLTIDSDKITIDTGSPAKGVCGSSRFQGANGYTGIVKAYSTTTLAFWGINGATSSEYYFGETGSNTSLATGAVTLSFTARVPIQGWASSVAVGGDAPTRRCIAIYAVGTGVSTTSSNPINYDTKIKDSHNAVTTGAGVWKFVAPFADDFEIDVITRQSAAAVNLNLFINGSLYRALLSTDQVVTSASTKVSLNKGDEVQIRPSATTTPTNPSDATTAQANVITIMSCSIPTTIAASETISLRYLTSSGQSIATGSGQTIVWGTKDHDTHGIMNTSTGVMTIPVAGKYEISSCLVFGAITNSATVYAHIAVNGVRKATSLWMPWTSNASAKSTGVVVGIFDLNKGDTVEIIGEHSLGGAYALRTAETTINWVNLKRVG